MGAYIPALIWLLSAAICFFITKRRNVRRTLFRDLVVVFLGPFAIPLVFLFKPEADSETAKR